MSSSIKWLSNQTYELFEQYLEGNFDRITLNRLVLEATEKAKEMEKERIAKAFDRGRFWNMSWDGNSYYEEIIIKGNNE